MQQHQIKFFAGSSHPELAKEISKYLKTSVSELVISKFACGEIYAKPKDTVRGVDAFVLQTGSSNINEDLMELFIILDSLKRSFAGRIHVVMPHYGYARQDRVATPREPISAKLVADLISAAGADHIITMKLHSDQEQGFFNFPVDNLSTEKLFAEYFAKKGLKDLVVVSPDAGGAKDAKRLANLLMANLAIIYKTRPSHNKAQANHVIGDVKGKGCLIYDDMIDTGGSVVEALRALKECGAKKVYLAATHAVFSDPAAERLRNAGFEEVVVTNTIPISKNKKFKGLVVLSVAPLLAKIIENIHEDKSVTSALL
ncbi:ribose-phosphate pyrophosphokinase [Candidatus Peregrinibacteria bacterium RIFCSPLOWO2_01_FULL_39_12]|nr:MAG: ribose-phosphate pyrophosphokinase [Candidatus Peregrinibacteria bacterium RIFCSPLOWO2_02_FULL_39_10]OGJ42947.1 MAG: ribose-phosphate pyrophosphokinase [Candidatus Peregrinibacteria bacterium RIFCSPLOWO2_01_FULL_39_12]